MQIGGTATPLLKMRFVAGIGRRVLRLFNSEQLPFRQGQYGETWQSKLLPERERLQVQRSRDEKRKNSTMRDNGDVLAWSEFEHVAYCSGEPVVRLVSSLTSKHKLIWLL